MTSQQIKDLTHQYIMTTYGRFPVAIDHGQGATLWDPEGKEYIDFTSGIGVTDLGYGYQPWVDAIAGGVERVHILDGRIPHSILIELLSDEGIGTMLKKED